MITQVRTVVQLKYEYIRRALQKEFSCTCQYLGLIALHIDLH